VVKQDNNSDTFLVTATMTPGIDEQALIIKVTPRPIGAWFPTGPIAADEPEF
jgi:hypothetical protein